MGRLDNITPDGIHDLKKKTSEGKPRERVPAAVGLKQGSQLQTLAARHGAVEKTIRNWFDQFEEQLLKEAPYDALRPGGPANHVGGGIQYQ